MLIIPAIDLLGGNVVRLIQGVEETAIVYSNDPLQIAYEYQKAGAKWIHIVNLDGAFGRPAVNDATITRLIQYLSVPLQLGGGIRTLDRIEFWLEKGIRRVIIGSMAVKEPELVAKAIKQHGNEAIVVSIDIRDDRVTFHGWRDQSQVLYIDLAIQMESYNLSRVIVTDTTTDGMLKGLSLNAIREIADKTNLHVIASGGVGRLKDLNEIAKYNHKSIEGVIIGKALYEKKLSLKKAITKFQKKD